MNNLTWKRLALSLVAVGGLAIAAACGSTTTVAGDGGINCGTGSTQCGDTCTVVARDSQNCGMCGKACAATELCSAGTCTPASAGCAMGTTKCGSECVDTKTDDRNCGMCGTKCGTNKVCSMGACADNCAMGTTKCGQSCVDQQNDRTNCGGCGTTCKAGEICTAGQCTLSCQQGLTMCTAQVADGGAPDAAADAASDAAADAAADSGVADAGPQLGSPYCANLLVDNTNCGGCGVTCTAGQKCMNGACKATTIAVGVMGGGFYTDETRTYLATLPFVSSATQVTTCTLAEFQKYNVIVMYGNQGCYDTNAQTQYLQGGGGIVATPWVNANSHNFAGLPITQTTSSTTFSGTLAITVTDPSDPILTGVVFNGTDTVGWESGTYALVANASASAIWSNVNNRYAVSRLQYGQGRSVYLNFHYITSDCARANGFGWGKQLMSNAVTWAAGLK